MEGGERESGRGGGGLNMWQLGQVSALADCAGAGGAEGRQARAWMWMRVCGADWVGGEGERARKDRQGCGNITVAKGLQKQRVQVVADSGADRGADRGAVVRCVCAGDLAVEQQLARLVPISDWVHPVGLEPSLLPA